MAWKVPRPNEHALRPDRTRDAAGRDSRGRFRPGVSGNPAKRFQPGTSGNPTGKPKSFSIHRLMADAIDDQDTRAEAVRRLQENLKNRRSVLPTLELAARLNREIGLGSEDRPPGITITLMRSLLFRKESERTRTLVRGY